MAQTTIVCANVPHEMTVPEAVLAWLAELRLANLARGTAEQYTHVMRVFSRWLLDRGVLDARDLTAEHCRAYLVERSARVRQWTLLQNRSVLVSFARWLSNNGLSAIDPEQVPRVATPHPDDVERRHLLESQVAALFAGLRRDYKQARASGRSGLTEAANLLVFALLFGSGLRISEVAALRSADVDIHARELFIRHAKGNRPRHVALPPSAAAYARLYMRLRPGGSPYLFPSDRRPGPVTAHSLARRVQRVAARHGLAITSHVGRRYCITRLASVNPFIAREQAGHRHLETTMLYVRQSRELLHAVVRTHDPLRHRAVL